MAEVLVQDKDGLPIRDALVLDAHCDAACVERGSIGVLTSTDFTGTARLRAEWVREHDKERLRVIAPEYLPGQVDVASLSRGPQVVVLEAGESHSIRCVTVAGDALAGVRLAACAASPPPAHRLAAPCAPGPDTNVALYSSISDEDGLARLRGMPAGQYFVAAHAPDHALVSGDPHGGTIEVPGSRTTLQFAKLMAVVFRFEGDVCVTSTVVMPRGWTSTGHAQSAVAEVRRSLGARFPECTVVASAQVDRSEHGPFLIRSLFERAGVQETRLLPVTVSECKEAQVVRVSATLTGSMADCEFVVLDSAGGRPPSVPLSVRVGDPHEVAALTVRLPESGRLKLPPGRYPVVSQNPFLSASLRGATVEAPGTNVIQLDSAFRPCRIWPIRNADGRVDAARVTAVSDARSMTIGSPSNEPIEVWLPVGICSLSVIGADGKRKSGEYTIDASSRFETQEIVIELE